MQSETNLLPECTAPPDANASRVNPTALIQVNVKRTRLTGVVDTVLEALSQLKQKLMKADASSWKLAHGKNGIGIIINVCAKELTTEFIRYGIIPCRYAPPAASSTRIQSRSKAVVLRLPRDIPKYTSVSKLEDVKMHCDAMIEELQSAQKRLENIEAHHDPTLGTNLGITKVKNTDILYAISKLPVSRETYDMFAPKIQLDNSVGRINVLFNMLLWKTPGKPGGSSSPRPTFDLTAFIKENNLVAGYYIDQKTNRVLFATPPPVFQIIETLRPLMGGGGSTSNLYSTQSETNQTNNLDSTRSLYPLAALSAAPLYSALVGLLLTNAVSMLRMNQSEYKSRPIVIERVCAPLQPKGKLRTPIMVCLLSNPQTLQQYTATTPLTQHLVAQIYESLLEHMLMVQTVTNGFYHPIRFHPFRDVFVIEHNGEDGRTSCHSLPRNLSASFVVQTGAVCAKGDNALAATHPPLHSAVVAFEKLLRPKRGQKSLYPNLLQHLQQYANTYSKLYTATADNIVIFTQLLDNARECIQLDLHNLMM